MGSGVYSNIPKFLPDAQTMVPPAAKKTSKPWGYLITEEEVYEIRTKYQVLLGNIEALRHVSIPDSRVNVEAKMQSMDSLFLLANDLAKMLQRLCENKI